MTPAERKKLKTRNLELFRQCMPATVTRQLKDLQPRWQLVFDADGLPDLKDGDRSVIRLEPEELARIASLTGGIAPGSIIRFTAQPPNRDWTDVHTFDFLENTLGRANRENIRFFDEPATTQSYFLVIFGIGLGRHIEPLVAKTKGLSVILVEPDIEFLWHSLETCDWVKLIGDIQARGGDVNFILTEDPAEISGNLWKTMKRTNPCSADGFVVCVQNHSHLVAQVIEDLKNDVSQITSDLGHFTDETIMLWNAHQNLKRPNARIFKRTPDKKRDVPAFVIGSGPSLDAALPVIKENAAKAVIISCGSALRPLMKAGIRPDFHVDLENMGVSPLVTQAAEEFDLSSICAIVSFTIEPAALAPFGKVIFYFRPVLSPYPLFAASEDSSLLQGGPTVANGGLGFAQETGFTEIYLFGVDMGARDPEIHHAKDTFHYTPEGRKRDSGGYSIAVKGNFGGPFLTTKGFYTARMVLAGSMWRFREGRRYFNCSDGALIEGAEALRPGDVVIPARSPEEKNGQVQSLIDGFSPPPSGPATDHWPGELIGETIETYISALEDCFRGIEDFEDKTYLNRVMEIFQPELGYATPPPREAMHAINFLFRGTLLGMLVFFEYYLIRVADRTQAARFADIGREEFINRLAEMKERALKTLAGAEPGDPPSIDEIRAAPARRLPKLLRIPRNGPCPCGSGRKYKHCHGASKSRAD